MNKRNALYMLALLTMTSANANDVLYTITYTQSSWIGLPGYAVIAFK